MRGGPLEGSGDNDLPIVIYMHVRMSALHM